MAKEMGTDLDIQRVDVKTGSEAPIIMSVLAAKSNEQRLSLSHIHGESQKEL